MIILDTNVVSEPMKPHAHPAVVAWLDQQVAETLYLTATSLAEGWQGGNMPSTAASQISNQWLEE